MIYWPKFASAEIKLPLNYFYSRDRAFLYTSLFNRLPVNINNFFSRDQTIAAVAGKRKTGSGDPDYSPRGGWLWRVMRSSLPIQLCLVALLLAAWLVERPRCCDALNSLAQTLTPQLRYVRGPPPVWKHNTSCSKHMCCNPKSRTYLERIWWKGSSESE